MGMGRGGGTVGFAALEDPVSLVRALLLVLYTSSMMLVPPNQISEPPMQGLARKGLCETL